MAALTVGQLMLSEILPPDVYKPGEIIDKKSVKRIFGELARNYPDKYKELLHRSTLLGRDVAAATGGASFSVDDLATPPRAAARRQQLAGEIEQILRTVPPREQEQAIIKTVARYQSRDSAEVAAEAEELGNPLSKLLRGAGRGNPASLARLIASDLMYADNLGKAVPIPILRSYSQGLTPGEVAASSFGARRGVVEAKTAVSSGGYAAKLLLGAAHRMVVTAEDGEDPNPGRGLPVDTDDEDNLGALLARDTGPYKRNTEITPKIAADLLRRGFDQILVRSPLTSADPDGGVYARDVGYRTGRQLPRIGDSVGAVAAGSVNEPITQSVLCLAKGTLVRSGDGGEVAIELVRPGDIVMGADRFGNTFPVRVVRVYDNGLRPCVETRFNYTKHESVWLRSTTDHKLLVTAARQAKGDSPYCVLPVAKLLTANYAVLADHATGRNKTAVRASMLVLGQMPTYDIEVDHPDHLFVLANGLIVSNSAKHKGGLATHEEGLQGFALIDKLINPPKEFRDAATHADADGLVTSIREAPQGGQYVTVGGKDHYVPAGRKLQVKKGDQVEAGDQLSDGPINPHMVIKHKGVGEGARQLTYALRDAIRGSGLNVHRRNLELVVRGLADRIEMTQEYEDFLPGDTVPYSQLAARYKPREGYRESGLSSVIGRYLEKPVLHYTIGTRITPKVVQTLKKHKVDRLVTHHEPPPFVNQMVRAVDVLKTDQDWMTRQIGTGLTKSLLEATHRSRVSDEDSTSFVPARVRATDFNRIGKVTNLQPPPQPPRLNMPTPPTP